MQVICIDVMELFSQQVTLRELVHPFLYAYERAYSNMKTFLGTTLSDDHYFVIGDHLPCAHLAATATKFLFSLFLFPLLDGLVSSVGTELIETLVQRRPYGLGPEFEISTVPYIIVPTHMRKFLSLYLLKLYKFVTIWIKSTAKKIKPSICLLNISQLFYNPENFPFTSEKLNLNVGFNVEQSNIHHKIGWFKIGTKCFFGATFYAKIGD
ncbi:hypothetical protein ACJX0J_021526, partial [Zea mays]